MNTATYPSIHPHIKPFDAGQFKVVSFELSEKEVEEAKMRAIFSRSSGEVSSLVAGRYMKLVDTKRQQIVMSDTPMELETNAEFVENAKGSVFVGGLGLGIVLMAIQKKPEVTRILVVEREQELVDRIVSMLPLDSKVEVVQGDIFTYETTERFNTQYFDIWNTICGDNWEEMKTLNARYRKNRHPKAWVRSWRQEDCRSIVYEENKYSW